MIDTLQYIYRDMEASTRYLPYGLAVGVPLAAVVVFLLNRRRKSLQKPLARWGAVACFCIYAAILLVITFLSRESGSRKGIDLELFSTWGINKRNNAYVIENVLLFIPYGFVCSWAFGWAGKLIPCMLFGAVTSLGIECMQLVTGRGFFQIDDILTNTLGSIIGFLLCRIFVSGAGDGK